MSAINEANIEIYNGSITNPAQAGMGTTVTAIAVVTDPIDGHVLGIANVGDSRSYVLRHGRLRQVTVDHSFVQELVAEGAITRAEARLHPRRNIVTRALGIEPGVRVDSWTMPIIRGDRFVLCSDGLVDEIDDDADHRRPQGPSRRSRRRRSGPGRRRQRRRRARQHHGRGRSTCSKVTIRPTRPKSST